MALTYKDIDMSKVSKGMKQYLDIKMKYMDNILFFRLGDFYEMFFDDAVLVSKELELTPNKYFCVLVTAAAGGTATGALMLSRTGIRILAVG